MEREESKLLVELTMHLLQMFMQTLRLMILKIDEIYKSKY